MLDVHSGAVSQVMKHYQACIQFRGTGLFYPVGDELVTNYFPSPTLEGISPGRVATLHAAVLTLHGSLLSSFEVATLVEWSTGSEVLVPSLSVRVLNIMLCSNMEKAAVPDLCRARPCRDPHGDAVGWCRAAG